MTPFTPDTFSAATRRTLPSSALTASTASLFKRFGPSPDTAALRASWPLPRARSPEPDAPHEVSTSEIDCVDTSSVVATAATLWSAFNSRTASSLNSCPFPLARILVYPRVKLDAHQGPRFSRAKALSTPTRIGLAKPLLYLLVAPF